MRISYYNGTYLPHENISIHPDDRTVYFGDGVYEVIRVYDGKPFTYQKHLIRLKQSANKIGMNPIEVEKVKSIINELMRVNQLQNGYVYIQISRGKAPRNHSYKKGIQPIIFSYVLEISRPLELQDSGVKAITTEDNRWHMCDVKSLNLLGSVMAKQKAVDLGYDEAIFVRDGNVTEGSATNIFVVKDNYLYTHPANHHILNGITRQEVISVAHEINLKVQEEMFNVEFLKAADEVFLTSTTQEIIPIIQVDDTVISAASGQWTNMLLKHLEKRF